MILHALPAVLRAVVFLIMATILQACNAPPLYEVRAREFLEKQGISSNLIVRLEERKPLTEREATILEELGSTRCCICYPTTPIQQYFTSLPVTQPFQPQ